MQVSECQIFDKMMNIGPNQVHMARFGMILCQNPSHTVWDASRMPPASLPAASRLPLGCTAAPLHRCTAAAVAFSSSISSSIISVIISGMSLIMIA